MAGIFGGGSSDYAGSGQDLYNQQQPSYAGDPYATGDYGGDYGGGGIGSLYDSTPYGGGYGSPTNPDAGYYDVGGGGAVPGSGGLFGGLGDWLSSEKGQRALQQLQGFSSGLLQGSAPSLQPRNFSTGLGMGMQGMQQAGSQYYTDALRRAQAQEAQAKVANLGVWDKTLQDYAATATGLPPGYGAPGMPGSGSSTPAVAIPPPSAGGDTPGTGPFAPHAALIQKYENASGNPNLGYGGEDLSKYPLSDTGFPQWAGKMGPAGNSTAAGLYQITRSTWDPIASQLGIKDFSPESQYKVAEALYNQRGLSPWLPYNSKLAAAYARGEAGPAGQADPALQVRLPIPSAPGATPAQRFADTPFQMPQNMAAGLGGPPVPGGISPQVGAAPVPAATQPRQGVPLASALPPPVAPAAAIPQVAVAAAPAVLAAARTEEPAASVYEPAGNTASIDRNVGNNPDYYRDKTVVLTPVGAGVKLDKLSDQIARVKEAGGQPVLQAGSNPKQNARMAQIAVTEGVSYRDRVGGTSDTGGGGGPGGAEIAPVPVNPEPSAAGNVPGAVPAAVAPPVVAPAATAPSPPPPAPPGTMAPGGALQLPSAPAAAAAPPGLALGTAPGMPVAPAPAPDATAPPGPPPPPVPPVTAAPGGPPGVMPGAIAPPPVAAPPRPLPVPNLGQVQPPGMGGIPPYDVEAARRAQVLSIVGAATGHPVPGYITDQANLPNKALEQQWAQQKELYTQQLGAARAQWQSMTDLQKEQYSAQNGLQKSQVESDLRIREENLKQGRWFNPQTGSFEAIPGAATVAGGQAGAVARAQQEAQRQRELDTPQQYKTTDDNGKPFEYTNTPRLEIQGIRPPGIGAPGAPGRQIGLAPGTEGELKGRAEQLNAYVTKVHSDAEAARTQAPDLEVLARLGPNIDWAGPGAPYKQMFNRATASAFGVNTENVASYEMAQQLMGGMLRKALRASDSNPTEKQQQMMLATFPTPESSKQGFAQGVSYMQGINDWQTFREEALRNWTQTHNNSADGFQEGFKLSAIPFVVQKMPQATRDAYFAQLKAADPSGKALHRLADQMEAVKKGNYNYSY